MSKKIAKTLHLTAGQWKTLSSLMAQPLSSSEDESVLRVGRIVQEVARGGGVLDSALPLAGGITLPAMLKRLGPPTLGELRDRGVRMPAFDRRLDGVPVAALVQGDETDGGVCGHAVLAKAR